MLVQVVWAHMCLNKELLGLHPRVHAHVMEWFLAKYRNLYIDISWDVLAKLLLLNWDGMEDIDKISDEHPDIHAETPHWNRTHMIQVRHPRRDAAQEPHPHDTGKTPTPRRRTGTAPT